MSPICCSGVSGIPFSVVSSLNVPGERALHARAVVAPDPDHDGVLELAHLVDRVDDPADVPVGVLGVARVDLHLTGVEALVRLVQRVPRRERVVARRQLRVGGDDAERLLARERLLAHHVPALVERAAVLVRPLARHVVRRVAAARRDVGEPRRLRLLGADPVEPVDRLVGEIVLEVVLLAVLGLGDADDLLVLGDQRVVLPGLTAEEAPEVVEPEPGRPAVERPREPLLVVRGQMPLPEPSRQVAVLLEHARKRRAIVRDRRVVAREGSGELAHHAEADPVVVAPRQQRRPGRRAERRDVEAVVAQPVVREPRVVRGLDRTAERARVAEARRRRSGRGARSAHPRAARRGSPGSSRASSRRASASSRPRTAGAGSEGWCGRSLRPA